MQESELTPLVRLVPAILAHVPFEPEQPVLGEICLWSPLIVLADSWRVSFMLVDFPGVTVEYLKLLIRRCVEYSRPVHGMSLCLFSEASFECTNTLCAPLKMSD